MSRTNQTIVYNNDIYNHKVGPRYNADQYNTKSDITRSDIGLQFVESMTVHFPRNGMKSATDR